MILFADISGNRYAGNSVALYAPTIGQFVLPLEVLPTRCVPGYTITANRNLTLPSSSASSSSVFDTVLY